MELEVLHLNIYCAALTTLQKNGQKFSNGATAGNKKHLTPAWDTRLSNKINCLRKQIGRIYAYRQTNTNRLKDKLPKELKTILSCDNHLSEDQIILDYLDTLKQKLSATTKRLRRYRLSYSRKRDNELFNKDEKNFYRKLQEKEQVSNNFPSQEEIEIFWKNTWSQKIGTINDTDWIQTEIENHNQQMNNINITVEDLKNVLSKLPNWKAPGKDGLQNFWYKRFTSSHTYLAHKIHQIVHDPTLMPDFLTNGVTYLLPKSAITNDPSQYRPITCLPTLYKIISGILCNKIYNYLEVNNILTREQTGCRRKSMGCKEQITIDSVIMEQARQQKRNLSMAFIDYQKAFDSVPHVWLIKVLKIYGINPVIISFLEFSMNRWCTSLYLSTGKQPIKTNKLAIEQGIFQGDSLSALWFCLAINPISNALNRTTYGFKLKSHENARQVTHLLYMDDLKLFAANNSQLQSLIKIVHDMSKTIGMSFGIKKCQTVCIKRGKLAGLPPMIIDATTTITAMRDDPYKYLGVLQTNKIEHKKIKESVITELLVRLHSLLRTKLNSLNLMKAINTYAIPAISFSFGIVKWTATDLDDINTKIRKALTTHKMHHPRASIERVTLARAEGGRGIVDVKEACAKQINVLRKYFNSSNSDLHRTICRIDKEYTPLNLSKIDLSPFSVSDKQQSWASKELHGRFHRELHLTNIDKQASLYWLETGTIFPETEGFIISIQDRSIATRNHRKFIHREHIDDKCRKCQCSSETIEHILSSCPNLANSKYLQRHNKVATILYIHIIKEFGLPPIEEVPYYKYLPPPVTENNGFTIYWDKSIITDLTIAHNRPDITLIDKDNKITYLIDVSIPSNNNIDTKYQEKINKYCDLKREVQLMWNMDKVYIVPIIISSMGLIPKNLENMLKLIKTPFNICRKMQKSVLLDAANIVRSVMEIN